MKNIVLTQVSLHSPSTLFEWKLIVDHQDSEWRYAALTPDAALTLIHKFSPGLGQVGIYPDRLTAGALGPHHGARDR